MKGAAKFLFDTSFDVESSPSPARPREEAGDVQAPEQVPSPPEPAAPPPPTYSEAELTAARAEGWAQGRADGESAALASIAQAKGSVLAAISDALPGLVAQAQEGLVTSTRFMLETALAGLRRLMPELNRRGGLAEIEGLLRDTMSNLRDESRIVVRLHDSLLDPLRADLDEAARAAGYEGKLVLLAEPDIPPGDCRIEWADGGVERVAGRIWNDIEAAVTRAIAAASTPSGAPAEAQQSTTSGPGAAKPQET
jgi:flagellar assembly protein FliH